MNNLIAAVTLVLGGCAGLTQTDQEKVVDYAGMSCAELTNESRTLLRQKLDNSEYLFEDKTRAGMSTKITEIKKAMAQKQC